MTYPKNAFFFCQNAKSNQRLKWRKYGERIAIANKKRIKRRKALAICKKKCNFTPENHLMAY